MNWPGLTLMPDTVRVEPLTTCHLARGDGQVGEGLAEVGRAATRSSDRRAPPSALDRQARRSATAGREPEAAARASRRHPAPAPEPLRAPKRGARSATSWRVLTVMVRAAMVVLDFFDGVPLTVTQSPLASALDRLGDRLGERGGRRPAHRGLPGVRVLHLHARAAEGGHAAAWPRWGRWAACVAAPAAEARAVAASSAVAPVPARRMKRRRLLLRLVSDCIVLFLFLFRCLCMSWRLWRMWDHSLRRASMGARVAARLAG